ncbi:GNAT family N-acetyltransferase [Sphaerisporangium aureirubrum]|uniref:GNAT family N-acetyltransferase n=1 Tax=Sphaerisporangium aureirubrum TaxID=1544736 RepID=A0ABW1NMI8_9ACTN
MAGVVAGRDVADAPVDGARFAVRDGLPEDWDAQAGDGPATLSSRWVGLAAPRLPGGLRTFGLYDGERLSVGFVGGVQEAPTGHPRFDPHMIFSGGSARDDVALAAGGPHPWAGVDPGEVFPCCLIMFPNYETAPAGRDARDPEAARRFADGLTRWARDNGIRSVAYLYLRGDHPEFGAALTAAGYTLIPMVERCDMRVGWTDFEGYLRTLSRNKRTAVRRELREIQARGITVTERAVTDDEPELIRLRCNLVAKYGGDPDPGREAHSLRYLRDHFGAGDLIVVEARKDGRMLAFSLFIRDGDSLTVLMNGTDYDDPDASFIYFATMFYRPAEIAPALGVRAIGYGIGTIAAKQSRGCVTDTLYAAVQATDRWETS